jgi:hypothetical protein
MFEVSHVIAKEAPSDVFRSFSELLPCPLSRPPLLLDVLLSLSIFCIKILHQNNATDHRS